MNLLALLLAMPGAILPESLLAGPFLGDTLIYPLDTARWETVVQWDAAPVHQRRGSFLYYRDYYYEQQVHVTIQQGDSVLADLDWCRDSAVWNGRGDDGALLPDGQYTLVLVADYDELTVTAEKDFLYEYRGDVPREQVTSTPFVSSETRRNYQRGGAFVGGLTGLVLAPFVLQAIDPDTGNLAVYIPVFLGVYIGCPLAGATLGCLGATLIYDLTWSGERRRLEQIREQGLSAGDVVVVLHLLE